MIAKGSRIDARGRRHFLWLCYVIDVLFRERGPSVITVRGLEVLTIVRSALCNICLVIKT